MKNDPAMLELAKASRFEAGKPADPTENMSPEDAAKWKDMNNKHRDKFKTALKRYHVGDAVLIGNRGDEYQTRATVVGLTKSLVKYKVKLDEQYKRYLAGTIMTAPTTMMSLDPTFKTADLDLLSKVALGDIPADVERYVKEVKESNPDYDDAQVWATAWSIYCKHGNPGSEHCNMDTNEYFKNATKALTKMAAGRSLSDIAQEVRSDWKKVYFGAVPYLQAMGTMDSIDDDYGMDSGSSIVAYFLANASTWRGDTAKRVKKELQAMLKGKRLAGLVNDPVMHEPDNSMRKNPLDPMATWEEGEIDLSDDPRDHPSEGSMIPGLEDRLAAEAKEAMLKTAGHTVSWQVRQEIPPDKWAKITTYAIKAIANFQGLRTMPDGSQYLVEFPDLKGPFKIKGPTGSGSPEITDDAIALNGDESKKIVQKYPPQGGGAEPFVYEGDQAHETFMLSRFESSDFCKTMWKPYDLVVKSILAYAKKVDPSAIRIGADGGAPVKMMLASEGKKNLTRAQGILGKKSSDDALMAELEMMANGCPENLDESECKEWEANTEKYQDVVKDQHKSASNILQAIHRGDKVTITNRFGQEASGGAEDGDDVDEKVGKFEKGKSADPTKNMSPEDAAEWKKQNDEHKDEFKTAGIWDALPEGIEGFEPNEVSPLSDLEEMKGNMRDKIRQKYHLPYGDGFSVRSLGTGPGIPDEGEFYREHGKTFGWYVHLDMPMSKAKSVASRMQRNLRAPQGSSKPDLRVVPMFFSSADGEIATLPPKMAIDKRAAMTTLASLDLELAAGSLPGTASAKAASDLDKDEFKSAGQNKNDKIQWDAWEGGVTVKEIKKSGQGNQFTLDHYDEDSFADKGTYKKVKDAFHDFLQKLHRMDHKQALAAAHDLFDDGTKWKTETKAPAFQLSYEKGKSASLEEAWNNKSAADPSGLYGYTRAIQSSCESSIRKMAKVATQLAKEAYRKDENVAPFLAAHAHRGGSLSAKILVSAMKTIGPKVASEMRKAELRAEALPTDRLTKAAARKYGLYGYAAKTASLGLQACTSLWETSGRVASEMHGRKADLHEMITGFLSSHAKEAKCMYSKMLFASYPDADRKTASVIAPTTVSEWLSWDD